MIPSLSGSDRSEGRAFVKRRRICLEIRGRLGLWLGLALKRGRGDGPHGRPGVRAPMAKRARKREKRWTMKFFRRYNRTAKPCRRSWTRSGASAIALSFGLVFGSACGARAQLTQQEVEDAVYNALISAPLSFNQGAINTVPWLYPSFGDLSIGEWLVYNTGYNGGIDPQFTLRSDLLLILSAVQSGNTNLLNFLRPVLAPSGQPNLYQVQDASLNALLAAGDDVDSIRQIDDAIYSILNQSGLSNYGQWLSQINQHLSSIRTQSGSANMNFPAFEVNDSYTHGLLEEIIDKMDEINGNIESGSGAGEIGAIADDVYAINNRLIDLANGQADFFDDWQEAFTKIWRPNYRLASPDKDGIQVFDVLTHMAITNLMRTERQIPGQPPRAANILSEGLQVFDPFAKLHYQYNTNFWKGFVDNLVVGSDTNRAIRVALDPEIFRAFLAYTNAVLGSYTGAVATISTNPIPERQEGLNPEDTQDYTQSLTDSFADVDSMLDPLRNIGSKIKDISIDPDFGDNSGNSRFYFIRPENAFWNSSLVRKLRSSDSDGGIYIDFAKGDLRNFCTKCNGFLEELIHWLQPIFLFLVMYQNARWTLNFFRHDRDI